MQIIVQSLPLRPHSPADLESVAMTELQEKQEKMRKKNMNHPIIICYFSNPYSSIVILTVTRNRGLDVPKVQVNSLHLWLQLKMC